MNMRVIFDRAKHHVHFSGKCVVDNFHVLVENKVFQERHVSDAGYIWKKNLYIYMKPFCMAPVITL